MKIFTAFVIAACVTIGTAVASPYDTTWIKPYSRKLIIDKVVGSSFGIEQLPNIGLVGRYTFNMQSGTDINLFQRNGTNSGVVVIGTDTDMVSNISCHTFIGKYEVCDFDIVINDGFKLAHVHIYNDALQKVN